MRFFTGISDLKGTNAGQRVDEVYALGAEAVQTYDVKESSKKFCSARD